MNCSARRSRSWRLEIKFRERRCRPGNPDPSRRLSAAAPPVIIVFRPMNTPIFDRIRGIAADILQVDPARITAASSPETIDTWDSVANLNLVLAIEESFGFQFDPEE